MADKVLADITALNIPRTPINCLTLLKINEQHFDQSPVNRTEMIRKVLTQFFYQFNQLPRYASRPDLIDCEYALGYFAEYLIRQKSSSFSKKQFFQKVSEYSDKQILNIEVDILFMLLLSEGILTKRGDLFEFRFSYWLYFFAAHRMHHDKLFGDYILSDKRYAAYPLILEFYSGMDRRRSDAVEILINDLTEMDANFLERSGIPNDLNPYSLAQWTPDQQTLETMENEVSEGMALTSLPAALKDEVADRAYDRSKPYCQEVAHFINQSSLSEYVHAMQGAARVLRNSDHVAPELRQKLLENVLLCWVRVIQTLVLTSKILAGRGEAMFDGMGFCLAGEWKGDEENRWQTIMRAIPFNVSRWFQEDLFSNKLGALFSAYIVESKESIAVHMIRRLMVLQRPPNWDVVIEKYFIQEKKNSFYMYDLYSCIRHELRMGSMNERNAQRLKTLAGMAVAKHSTGKKKPDQKLIQRAINKIFIIKDEKAGKDGEKVE